MCQQILNSTWVTRCAQGVNRFTLSHSEKQKWLEELTENHFQLRFYLKVICCLRANLTLIFFF